MKNLNSFGYDEPDDDEHDHNAAASVADDHDRHHFHTMVFHGRFTRNLVIHV